MGNPYSFFFKEGNIHINKLQSIPPPSPAVKQPARSEEGEDYSGLFANNLLPLNHASLPGTSMMTAVFIPILSAHNVA